MTLMLESTQVSVWVSGDTLCCKIHPEVSIDKAAILRKIADEYEGRFNNEQTRFELAHRLTEELNKV